MAREPLDQLLLATLPPSPRQVRLALCIVVALLVAFCAAAPFATVQLWRIDAFIPILATTILITGLITSALLFSQFYVIRHTALLVLASGYFFTALIVIPYALTFPGSFSPRGLLGAGSQTTAWLYTCWHVGSSVALLVYALIKDVDINASMSRRSPAAAISLSIAVVTAIVCGMTLASVAGHKLLAKVVLDGVQLNCGVISLLGGSVIALNAAHSRCYGAGGALCSIYGSWSRVVHCCL